MSRVKSFCPNCGKSIASAKLISLPGSNKKLCSICRNRALKKRNKLLQPEINNSMSKSSIKQRSLVRPSKFRYNRLTKDEDRVLIMKYQYDSFKSGNASCFQLKNLKNKLKENVISKIKSDNNSKIDNIKNIERKKKLNKDFTDGLK